MSYFMKTLLTILFCTMLSSDGLTKTLEETPIKSTGQTIISSNIDSHKIRVFVNTREKDIGKPNGKTVNREYSNCTYARFPCSLVENVKIFVNEKSVFVPRSAFADLADLNTAQIKKSALGSVLIFTGGDASESYVVEIIFNSQDVIERTMFDAGFPDNVWQKTTYVFKPIEE